MSDVFIPTKIEGSDKSEVFQQAIKLLVSSGFKIIDVDILRPWGFFISIDESQSKKFIDLFYEGASVDGIDTSLPMRPKILGFAPGKRLSWQYHHRRSEIWRCIGGSFDVVSSKTDDETLPRSLKPGDTVVYTQGTRHRGIGKESWSLAAEIWQHTDPSNPSDEDDIVRLQDDFGRQSS